MNRRNLLASILGAPMIGRDAVRVLAEPAAKTQTFATGGVVCDKMAMLGPDYPWETYVPLPNGRRVAVNVRTKSLLEDPLVRG